jgi:hypothetical protein
MKVWITKYALTQGIYEIEARTCYVGGGEMIEQIGCERSTYYHGKEWQETKELAIEQAEFMRQKKIESLKKQVKKLEELKFV